MFLSNIVSDALTLRTIAVSSENSSRHYLELKKIIPRSNRLLELMSYKLSSLTDYGLLSKMKISQ